MGRWCISTLSVSGVWCTAQCLFCQSNKRRFSKANQEDDPTAGLVIKGLFLKIEHDLCLPLPLDCVEDKDKKRNDNRVFPLALRKIL